MIHLGMRSEVTKSVYPDDLSTTMREEVPESEVASTSSGTLTYDDDSSFERSAHDPYADVRARMESLAARERQRYADSGDPHPHAEPDIPALVAYTSYLNYAILIFIGHLRDFCAFLFQRGRYIKRTNFPSDNAKLFAPLLQSWENFFTRRLYTRIQDCFNRPIGSSPGAQICVLERVSYDGQKSMQLLGSLDNLENQVQRDMYTSGEHYVQLDDGSTARKCLNLGSYNYLGFADDWNTTCAKEVKGSLSTLPISVASSRSEYGSTDLHRELEKTVARFLNKEDALCLNMGFNTNATTIPALVGRGDLIISDSLNHTSIVNGARASGAAIRVFRHNDVKHLEEIMRESIVMGRPRTRRPWNKILVAVEGIYSMEGEYCDLKNVVRIAKKYGAYVYLDEAHSIGAMGETGRGCTEYTGVDPADVDIMMGTFTKSFGGMGGYIAASKEIISYLRMRCSGSAYHASMSPVVCQQVLTSFKIILGEDGSNIGKSKLKSLRDNSNYFRMRLQEMGLEVLGRYDSPIMPVMLYNPCKIGAFSRETFKRGLAVVVVGFPAVPLLLPRARFCISASHTRAELDRALESIDEIASILHIKYAKNSNIEKKHT